MHNTIRRYGCITVLPLLALAGCDGDGDSGNVTAQSVVAVQFLPEVNGTSFTCGANVPGVGSGTHDYMVDDFRFYIYDVHINDSASGQSYTITLDQDGTWQLNNVAFIDLENGCGAGTPEMNDAVTGTMDVPATVDLNDTELCFTLGVPFDMNHIDEATAASPMNASGMLWAWRNGRKFIRIDGVGDPGTANQAFNLHLGSQGCSNTAGNAALPPDSACTSPNTVEVCLANFDLANDTVTVDPAPVLAATDISLALGGAPGCQSFPNDDDCIEVMPRLGLDYSYGSASSTSAYAGDQLLFKKSP